MKQKVATDMPLRKKKIRQANITMAYQTLGEMGRVVGLPFRMCKELFMLRLKLKPFIDCQLERRQVLCEAAGIAEDGTVEMTPSLKKSLFEIQNDEVEWTEEPVKIEVTPELAEKLNITAEKMEYLDGFVEFVEVGA